MKLKLLYSSLLVSALFLNSSFSQTLIPDPVFEQYLIDQNLDTAPINGSVPTANIVNVTSLNVSGTGVSDLTGIEDFTSLTFLDVSENTLLNSLDISNNTALVDLIAFITSLSSIDLTNNTSLIYVNFYTTSISSLDVSNNTLLEYINVYDTSITTMDVSNISSLNYLNVASTGIGSLDVTSNTQLDLLYTDNTPNLNCINVLNEVEANAGQGIYTGWLKDANAVYSENCANLSNLEFNSSEIYVGPNPLGNQLHIQLVNNAVLNEVVLFDISGKLLLRSTKSSIYTDQLQSGIYLAKIITDKGTTTRKLIKE
jgi:hypothetical protein